MEWAAPLNEQGAPLTGTPNTGGGDRAPSPATPSFSRPRAFVPENPFHQPLAFFLVWMEQGPLPWICSFINISQVRIKRLSLECVLIIQ